MESGRGVKQRYDLEDHLANTWMSKYLTEEDVEKLYSKYSSSKGRSRRQGGWSATSSRNPSRHLSPRTTDKSHKKGESGTAKPLAVTVNLSSKLQELAAAQNRRDLVGDRKRSADRKSTHSAADSRIQVRLLDSTKLPTRIPSLKREDPSIEKSTLDTAAVASENWTQTSSPPSLTTSSVQTSPRNLPSPAQRRVSRSGPYHSPLVKVVDEVSKAPVPPDALRALSSPRRRHKVHRSPEEAQAKTKSPTDQPRLTPSEGAFTTSSDGAKWTPSLSRVSKGVKGKPLPEYTARSKAQSFAMDLLFVLTFFCTLGTVASPGHRVFPS